MKIKALMFAALMLGVSSGSALASDAGEHMDGAAGVLRNMTGSHQIPGGMIGQAECVAVIPALNKAGVIVGGEYGEGVISCRTSKGWSAPGFISISGGDVGLQAGLEHVDLVLLMNKQGEKEIEEGHWTASGEATATGPDTKSAGGAETQGWKSNVLAYKYSSGAYVGANVGGKKIATDDKTMKDVYGPDANLTKVLSGSTPAPQGAQAFLTALKEVSKK